MLRALAAGLAAVLATALVPATAHAAPPRPATPAATTAPRVDDLGPGIVSAPVTGAAIDGNSLYLVTRGLQPAVIARYDLTTRTVVDHAELPTGTGGWAAAVDHGAVYAGMYGVADIHRYDPATGTATRLTGLGTDAYVFDLAAAPDGTLYAGTYPSGKLYAVDPDTGATSDLGQVSPGQRYVRSVAVAGDGTVYAGTGAAARLVAYDPATGQRTEILPEQLRGEAFVYDLAVTDDLIAVGTEPSGKLALIDRHDPSRYTIVDTGDRTVDAITIDGDSVYLTARTSGSVYRYRRSTQTLQRLGTPVPQDETRGVFVSGGQLVGVAGSGEVWTLDPDTGATTVTDLVAAGMPAAPEPAQSVAVQDGRYAYVGGNFGLQVHDLAAGTSRRVRAFGEPKRIVPVDGRAYLGVYPGGFVDTYDPATDTMARRGELGGGQNRPRAMAWLPDRGQLAIGSRAEYGTVGGAFTLYDVASDTAHRYDPVPGQSISAVAAQGHVGYAGSEIAADGVPPAATEAQLAAVDLNTGRTLWRWTAVPGATGWSDLLAHGNRLYGLTSAGRLVVLDPGSQTVLASYQLADAGGGQLFWRGGTVYGVTKDTLFRLTDAGPATVLGGLGGGWFNEPQASYDPAADVVYTLRGTDLVRIHL
ncbi:PQQ-binding-like beta-propeller repeat protein [Actinocatenispora sera]|uniref:outer membrane protein assembly factor BamB family protein n=1 Tax=Actinocatenispora sera TaxID=390989 RepID=UPI0033D387FB